jgi:3-deoxy-D-manno-octulosonic-acid transferase
MNKLSIALKFKKLFQRIFAIAYFNYNHADLPSTEKQRLKELKHYIAVGSDLLASTSSSLVLYAATIGELRAASQFITTIKQKFPESLLVLVPGQAQYIEVYAKIYPFAVIMKEFPSHPTGIDEFFKATRVKACIFIEGPSLHGYFPIRQDLSLAAGCLRFNTPLFVINACLYKLEIGSRFEQIEHRFFGELLPEAISCWFIPNQQIEQDFSSRDVPKQKLLVTGDIKLDNVFSEALPPMPDRLAKLLAGYVAQNCRLIVAGSVNEYDEQIALIKAWLSLLDRFPTAVLILVPRYINDQVMMGRLYQFLNENKIPYAKRSDGLTKAVSKTMLVVDVFGELPYLYQAAEIAFAGRGHGVLEPMKYLKPVVIGPHTAWEKVGSTAYYLFANFVSRDALIECKDYDRLDECLALLLSDSKQADAFIQRYSQVINEQMGASERIVNSICEILTES